MRRSWKWLSGVLLAALAAVIAGYVADANHWFWHKVGHSSPALSVVVLPVPPLGSSSAAGESKIDDHGKPFRVAAVQHVVRVFPDYARRKWQILGSG